MSEEADTIQYVKRGLILFFCIQLCIGVGAIVQMYYGQQLIKHEFNNLKEQVTELKKEIKEIQNNR